MFTKKEKLLVRPWIDQRYHQHREKVIKAVPRIDFHPPPEHNHVTLKLKKAQRELERQRQIEKENIRLLQRLGAIMNKKRIDNFWTQPRPNFLSREPIIDYVSKASRSRSSGLPDLQKAHRARRMSRSAVRCSACSPNIVKFEMIEPSERIPFAPPRETTNRKLISRPSQSHICCVYCC